MTLRILTCSNMFFIVEATHTDLFKYVFHSGSDEIFVSKISV